MIHLQGFPDDILLTLAGCKYPEISAFHIHSNYYIGVLAWWSGGLQYRNAVLYCSIVLQYCTAVLYCSIVLCWGFHSDVHFAQL